METLTVNIVGNTRTEELHGRKYLVAPLSMIVPGVLNGSEGPLLYLEQDLVSSQLSWNGLPITLNHPMDDNNGPTSARLPNILEKYFLGWVFNCRFDKALKAEGWFDILRCDEVDPRIINRIKLKEPIELSTGLFTTNEKVPQDSKSNIFINAHGETKTYKAIARNHVPDHLAILLDNVGACSIREGCGVMVDNNKKEGTFIGKLKSLLKSEEEGLVDNDAGFSEIRKQIRTLLDERFPSSLNNIFIEEIFTDHFVFNNNDTLFRMEYSEKDGIVSLDSAPPSKVLKKVEFVAVTNKEQKKMTEKNEKKTELIDNLVNNCKCWEEADREVLNTFSEEKLTALQPKDPEKKEPVKNSAKDSEEKSTISQETLVANSQQKEKPKEPLTLEQSLDLLHPEIREVVANSIQSNKKTKQELIVKLTANVSDKAKKERITTNLETKTLSELEDMAELLPSSNTNNQLPNINNRLPNQRFLNANIGSENTTPTQNQLGDEGDTDSDDVQAMSPPTLNYKEISEGYKENQSA